MNACIRSAACGLLLFLASTTLALEPIRLSLPPAGTAGSADEIAQLTTELRAAQDASARWKDHALAPDVEVFIKAVDLAIRHREFYRADDVARVRELLRDSGMTRSQQLADGQNPWTRQRGRVVRGYRSRIDQSVQPYGLVIPDDLDFDKPVPLYVWLHGRGDNQTDVHFIRERATRDGQIKPAGAIVLHPFGRHCLGFKSAGEIDVLEAIEHVHRNYRIDPDRIVLIGFSMGGAGAWHIGAHYTDRFVAISPGAGFAETARYQRIKQESYPPVFEQRLWSMYDVPNYVRNLFNRTVVAYSGENDPQMQAARIMEEAYQDHGKKLTHLIGPGMGHQYHPETLKQILEALASATAAGRTHIPLHVSLQTPTLRYNHMDWVTVLRLNAHWQDARVDAEISGDRRLRVATKNVASVQLSPWPDMAGATVEIDGQSLTVPRSPNTGPVLLVRAETWRIVNSDALASGLAKRPGLQGPIDDVFLEPFLVVLPSGKVPNGPMQEWIDAEQTYLQNRWRALFRGELRIKRDSDVTSDDVANYHLIAWGTPTSNSILARAFSDPRALPVQWSAESVSLGQQKWAGDTHVPSFIYPNPLNRNKYLVVNSGPTFREAHNRTNSLQNPKLPDWAIIDISQPPSANAPGRIAAADFFGEQWQVK